MRVPARAIWCVRLAGNFRLDVSSGWLRIPGGAGLRGNLPGVSQYNIFLPGKILGFWQMTTNELRPTELLGEFHILLFVGCGKELFLPRRLFFREDSTPSAGSVRSTQMECAPVFGAFRRRKTLPPPQRRGLTFNKTINEEINMTEKTIETTAAQTARERMPELPAQSAVNARVNEADSKPDVWYTTRQIADNLALDLRTVRKLISAKEFGEVLVLPGRGRNNEVRVRKSGYDNFIRERLAR